MAVRSKRDFSGIEREAQGISEIHLGNWFARIEYYNDMY